MITIAILILIVAKALPVLNTHISSIHITRITSIVFLFAGALSFNCLNFENIDTGIGLYSGLFQVTAISQLIEIFFFTIGGGILIAWPLKTYNKSLTFTGKEKKIIKITANSHSTDYSLVVLFSSLGSSLLLSSYDLISVYLSIELQSFGLYVLSTLYRNSESSTSAGLKYFLLGGLSSCIILLGTGIIYSYTVTTNLEYSYIINIFVYNNIIKSLLLISATLSLIIGSLLGLAQIKIKRLLAYSTISHIGFILLALAVNTEQSIDSFIFYIIQYTITNLNIFLVILGCAYILYYKNTIVGTATNNCSTGTTNFNNFAAEQLAKDISFIYQFKGLFFNNPLLSLALVISLFSMAGIPPLIGFFSKQLVLYSAIQNGYYFISLVGILVSIISCSYYLQIIKIIFSNEEIKDSSNLNNKLTYNTVFLLRSQPEILTEDINGFITDNNSSCGAASILTNTHSYLISTLTFIILLFFIKPTLILNSTQLLSLSLFYI